MFISKDELKRLKIDVNNLQSDIGGSGYVTLGANRIEGSVSNLKEEVSELSNKLDALIDLLGVEQVVEEQKEREVFLVKGKKKVSTTPSAIYSITRPRYP